MLLNDFPYLGLAYRFPWIYSRISNIEGHNDFPYVFSNEELIERLRIDEIKEGSVIIDLCCGTGVFSFWLAEQRPDLYIIGIDNSAPMLNEAKSMAIDKKINNISFILKSIIELTKEDLYLSKQSLIKSDQLEVAMITSFLGFSAIKNYEEIFKQTLPILSEGGTYLILDMYREPKFINKIANFLVEKILLAASSFRRCFDPLKNNLAEYEIYQKTIPDDIIRILPSTMSPYIARGIKKLKTTEKMTDMESKW